MTGPGGPAAGSEPSRLADGTYDAIVVDADGAVTGGDGDGRPEVVTLCLTITSGDRKGEVVDVQASHLQHDPLDLLAMPCILVVKAGRPTVIFD